MADVSIKVNIEIVYDGKTFPNAKSLIRHVQEEVENANPEYVSMLDPEKLKLSTAKRTPVRDTKPNAL